MIVLYARVSTTDQTTAHRINQAKAAGFKIDKVLSDEGVSGMSTRLAERPQGKRLFDMLRSGDTLVVRWVDRLGRNYIDVVDTIRDFMRRGVIIRTVIHSMTFDGSAADPMQQGVRDALIAFMAATAQAQAEATKSAQRAGIDQSAERSLMHTWNASRPTTGLRSTASDLLSMAPTAEPISYRQGRGIVQADDIQIEAGPAGGVGGVGRMRHVTATLVALALSRFFAAPFRASDCRS
jgi:putative DNA-invertase from lambdoid prophage Rac